jgi:hypothetical protein
MQLFSRMLAKRFYQFPMLLILFILAGGLLVQGREMPKGGPRFDRVVVESLDPDAWNGVVFVAKAYQQKISFALRVGSRRLDFLDGEKIFKAVSEVGPHAPDASYCRVSWRHPPYEAPVTLEWSRIDETTVVGCLNSMQGLQLVLETYFSNSTRGSAGGYAVDESRRAIFGESYFDSVFNHVARLVVMTDRPLTGSGAYRSLADLQAGMDGPGRLAPSIPDEYATGAAGLEFADSVPAHFVALIGWEKESLLNQASALLAPGKIDAILKERAGVYAARRPTVGGLFEGAPRPLAIPCSGIPFTPPSMISSSPASAATGRMPLATGR